MKRCDRSGVFSEVCGIDRSKFFEDIGHLIEEVVQVAVHLRQLQAAGAVVRLLLLLLLFLLLFLFLALVVHAVLVLEEVQRDLRDPELELAQAELPLKADGRLLEELVVDVLFLFLDFLHVC